MIIQEEKRMSKKIFVVIGFDIEDAWIEPFVFITEHAAEEKCRQLNMGQDGDNFTFTVQEIELPEKVLKNAPEDIEPEGITLAEAVSQHADAMWKQAEAFENIAESLREFTTCACSHNLMDNGSPIRPTISIKGVV